MCSWWFFTFTSFWFNARNIENPQKFQDEFQWTTKYGFWQDYVLHMWLASTAKHFEPIEHYFFIKWFKKWILCLAMALSFKILKLWIFCTIWFFIKFIQWICTFIEGAYLSLKSIVWPYAFLLIHFQKTMYFIHLIILVYRIQNDIYIVFKLF